MLISGNEDTQKEDLKTTLLIRTFSGKYFNYLDPDPETILLTDIAHSLARMPRFAGHLPRFYSVASHSLKMASLVPPEYKLEALLHDASEAYVMDLPKPLKNLIPGYKQIESRVMNAIALKFGIPAEKSELIEELDNQLIQEEWEYLMLSPESKIAKSYPDQKRMQYVEQEFLHTAFTLTSKV